MLKRMSSLKDKLYSQQNVDAVVDRVLSESEVESEVEVKKSKKKEVEV